MRKTIGCLTDFSVISSNSDLLEIQVFALEVLSEKSYDPKCPIGYEMVNEMFETVFIFKCFFPRSACDYVPMSTFM